MARYVSLSLNGAASLSGVTHLIWPESAFPFLLTQHPEALTAIADLLPKGTTLLTGAARAERVLGSDAAPLVFNSIYVIDDAGEIRAAYDKVHLVPFGEYLPFGGLLRALGLRQLIALPGGFSPGESRRTLVAPDAPPFAPLICYEAIFPGDVVAPGARPAWMLNVTNDAWYGGDRPVPTSTSSRRGSARWRKACHWYVRRTRGSRRSSMRMAALSPASRWIRSAYWMAGCRKASRLLPMAASAISSSSV